MVALTGVVDQQLVRETVSSTRSTKHRHESSPEQQGGVEVDRQWPTVCCELRELSEEWR